MNPMTALLAQTIKPGLLLKHKTTQSVATRWFSIAQFSLIALLMAAPLAFGAVQVWAWAALAVSSIGLLLCWAIGCVRQHAIKISWCPLYLLGGLFILLGLLQLLTDSTQDRIGTREALIKLATDLLLFFLGGQIFTSASKNVWYRSVLGITLYTFALSLFAIIQFFSRPDLIYWTVDPRWGGYIFGPYVNHNHYAGLMEMLIPIVTVFLLSQAKSQPLRWLIGFALAVSFASVVLSGSRGGLVSLLVESVLFGAILLTRLHSAKERQSAILASLALASGMALFLWVAPPDVFARLGTLLHSPELSYADRKQISFDSLKMFEKYPLLGTGIGSFETVYPQYQSLATDQIVDHAHNDFAEALAEVGLTGGLLILISLVVFFNSFSNSVNRGLQDIRGWIRLGAGVGCCGMLIHSFVDFNLKIPANAAWFALTVAIATSAPSDDLHSEPLALETDEATVSRLRPN
jgi:O-antigen ligase